MTAPSRVALVHAVTFSLSALGLAMVPRALEDRTPSLESAATWSAPRALEVPGRAADYDGTAAPFRKTRTPPTSRFDALAASSPDVAPSERPPWRLTGILSGAPSIAVFEGFPADEAPTRLLAAGDSVAGYVVVAIQGDSAVVSAQSIRWTFFVDQPWR